MAKKMFFVALAFMLFGLPAFGSNFTDTYGFGVRAMSLGGAFTAVADDYSAAFYNPAGLGTIKNNHVSIDYVYTKANIKVQKLSGGDLVINGPDGQERNNPASKLNLQLPIIGLILDINQIINIPVQVTFGAGICLPENSNVLYRIFSYPPDQPHFTRYGNDIDRSEIVTSIGVEALKKLLYVGAGIQSTMYGDGKIYVDGNLTENENVIGEVKQPTLMRSDIIAGLLVTPLDQKLKIGFSYRDKEQVEIDPLANIVPLSPGLPPLYLVMGMFSFFTPRELSLGVSYDFDKFMVTAEANRQFWSQYKFSPSDQTNYSLLISNPGFKNTTNLRLGLEYKFNPGANIAVGYCYQPSPIPNQSYKITNYIDTDKNIFSLGGKYSIPIPKFLPYPLEIKAMVQYQNLKSLTVYKDSTNQGLSWVNQESYTVKGNAFSGGLSVHLAW